MDRDGASSNSGKGLQYSYQEFSCLCNSIRDRMDRASAQVFYCRMAKSFMCCYGEIVKPGITHRMIMKRKIIINGFKHS